MRIKVIRMDEDLAGASYRHDLFEFDAGGTMLVARSYVNSPEEVHFLRKEIDGRQLSLDSRDLESDLFRAAVRYLRDLGKTTLSYLSLEAGGYIPVDA